MKRPSIPVVNTINYTLIVVSAILINSLFSYKEYNLYINGKWESTKTKAEKGVMHAWAMIYGKTALSQNHLNIAAWHGYQELILKRPLKFQAVTFKCKSFNNPFSFILNKTDTGSIGFYFSYKTGTSCFFRSDAEGKFIEKHDFRTNRSFDNNNWNKISCSIRSNILFISINDQVYYTQQVELPDSLHIGFRGGNSDAYIDDVMVSEASKHNILIDDFSPPFTIKWQAILFLFLMILVYLSFGRKHALNFILLNVIIPLGILCYSLIFFYYLSTLYSTEQEPIPDILVLKAVIESEESICKRLKQEYPTDKITGQKPVIICIGSSQTWGAGASNISYTYPSRLEQRLREYYHDTNITVINTGISGAHSDKLLAYYESDWIKYKPVLTIIDLSTNDSDPIVFRKSIRKFIDLDHIQNIKTLLVLEPNDTPNNSQRLNNHVIMRSEAVRGHVEYLDQQDYIDNHLSSGFIWWDYVHMTDYGYRSFAENLLPSVISTIGADSLELRKYPRY